MPKFKLTDKIFWNYHFNKGAIKSKWALAFYLGDRLRYFLGSELFALLLDSMILIDRKDIPLSNDDYKLLPACKAYEGFLRKILVNRRLITKKIKDIKPADIGGSLSSLGKILKNKKLAKEAIATWDLTRNEICHHQVYPTKFFDVEKAHNRIVDIMRLLFGDLYGASKHESISNFSILEQKINEDLKNLK